MPARPHTMSPQPPNLAKPGSSCGLPSPGPHLSGLEDSVTVPPFAPHIQGEIGGSDLGTLPNSTWY